MIKLNEKNMFRLHDIYNKKITTTIITIEDQYAEECLTLINTLQFIDYYFNR